MLEWTYCTSTKFRELLLEVLLGTSNPVFCAVLPNGRSVFTALDSSLLSCLLRSLLPPSSTFCTLSLARLVVGSPSPVSWLVGRVRLRYLWRLMISCLASVYASLKHVRSYRYGSHVRMQLLCDVIHCDYSFAISNPLAKVARLKCTQNIPKVRYNMLTWKAACI